MKKITLLGFAVLSALSCMPVQAQEIPSASIDVFDFSPWDDRALINLFAKAADEGRNVPTAEEFAEAGFNIDLEFARSHVRYNPILEQSVEKNLVKTVFPTRRIWMNIPTGAGKGVGGYPSSEFHSDVYSMWNYTHIFGAWNHGFMQAPGAWVDAAHRNGTYIYSGIEFFDTTGGDSGDGARFSNYCNFMNTKNADGSFKYVDAILNCLIFLGQDGLNYNFEAGYPTALSDVHAALYARAKEIGFDSFHIGSYSSASSLSTSNAYFLLCKSDGSKVSDTFLNYAGGDFNASGAAASLKVAKDLMGTAEDVYQGAWIVSWDRSWNRMNMESTKEMNLCLWGEHSESRFWQYNVGSSNMNAQENYQLMMDRVTSGGNRNVLDRPALASSGHQFGNAEFEPQFKTWAGLAELAPERSAISGDLPFNTNFTLGNGEIYFYKGKKTLGSWYNMSQQDYVPTYRWLQSVAGNMTTAASDIDVRFTHEDAYIGGSSIRLSGEAAATGNDIVIYRTDLNVTAGNVKATLAVKSRKEGKQASCLSLIVKKLGGEWIEVPYGDIEGNVWESKTLAVSGLSAGDNIEYIGLRVKGSSSDYQLWVGQIMLSDDRAAVTPAPIKDDDTFLAEVKEETQRSLSVKLNWEVNDAGYTTEFKERGMVFNDEVNIDHFEILYKDGEEGKAYEVGRTSSWCAYIGKLELDETTKPFIGVRSVSVDLKTCSPVVWVEIPRYADQSALPSGVVDKYPAIYIDRTSNGYETALEQRWFDRLTTTGASGDINYTATAAPGAVDDPNNNNYVLVDQVLTLKQGETVKVNVRAYNSGDDMRYCLINGYLDWDCNGLFDGESDELVWEHGLLRASDGSTQAGANNGATLISLEKGVDFTINVPEDATPGDSRLRFVACDAWFTGGLGPEGGYNKGFGLDVPVKIIGDNPGRVEAGTYQSYRDQGEADSPLAAIDDIVVSGEGGSSMSFYPAVATDVINFTDVDKAWIYNLSGQMIKFVPDATAAVSVSDLSNGAYIVKMQKGRIIRSGKLIKK